MTTSELYLTGRGLQCHSAIAAASVNATVVKAETATLEVIDAINTNAAVRYLKLYDKATAPASTDTPVLRFPLPQNARLSFCVSDLGVAFPAGLAYRITTGQADNDTGALTAGDVVLNLVFA